MDGVECGGVPRNGHRFGHNAYPGSGRSRDNLAGTQDWY
jgi:hypothetical protein